MLYRFAALAECLSFLVGLRRLGASLVSIKPVKINMRNPTSACFVLVTKDANTVYSRYTNILH